MPPSFELYDDDAWDRGEAIWLAWKKRLFDRAVYIQVADIVKKHRPGRPVEVCAPKKGAFNVHYRVKFADGGSAAIRFPIPAYYQFSEEKLRAEVAVMRYVREHTSIPVPFVFYHGTQAESPGGLGPFIIMEYIEHAWDMCDVLVPPGTPLTVKPVLDPAVDEAKLEKVYGEMAGVLLQLSKCTFGKIGCLQAMPGEDEDGNDSDSIASRPFTFNMAQLGEVGGCPPWALPDRGTTYSAASDYYAALADMHLQQLSYQRNGAVESAEDCRRKYIARQLFRRLAAGSRLAPSAEDNDAGPFPLWCDDLRPSNVLLDSDLNIVGVVDWEFSYAAPASFTWAPPWWLLLTMPEEWRPGLDDWAAHYEPRLRIFLRALEAREAAESQGADTPDAIPLSEKMRQSWATGDFWLAYAARKSWAFDGIFWRTLDGRFFGEEEGADASSSSSSSSSSHLARLRLLPQEQADAMEAFVARKLREKDERTLVDWYALKAEEDRGKEEETKADTGVDGQGSLGLDKLDKLAIG